MCSAEEGHKRPAPAEQAKVQASGAQAKNAERGRRVAACERRRCEVTTNWKKAEGWPRGALSAAPDVELEAAAYAAAASVESREV